MGKNQNFQEFIGVSPLQKTLRNELIPTETTKKNITQLDLLTEDEIRAQNREKLKEMMDDYYRDVIDSTLHAGIAVDWSYLFSCMRNHLRENSKESKRELERTQDSIRSQIHNKFAERADFKDMFGASIITKLLPTYIKQNPEYSERYDESMEILKLYGKFTTSLTDYFETRKNIFSKEKISSAVGYRIVEENAEIFLQNQNAYDRICKIAGLDLHGLDNEITAYVDGKTLKEVCSDEGFAKAITQEGIDRYNEAIGAVNQYMNLFCQKNKALKSGQFKMKRLHKQILCKGTTSFDIPKKFENDKQVYDAVNSFTEIVMKNNDLKRLLNITQNVNDYDMNKIYVAADAYSTISQFISKKWNLIEECLLDYYSDNLPGKGNAKENKVKKAVKEETYRSVSQLNELIEKYYVEKTGQSVWKVESYILRLAETITLELCHEIENDEKHNLIEDDGKISKIKELLDMYMDVFHIIKVFRVKEVLNFDETFYSEIDEIYQDMQEIVPLYNHVRNYVTQKPYKQEKYRLYFNTPTLANGWSKNKEYDNNAIILMRDDKYYLGILNAKKKPSKQIMAGKEDCLEHAYAKMNYYLLPGANKMLPKVFLSKKGIHDYHPSSYIVEGYNEKKHIKGSKNFDIQFCRDLIDYFKECIKKHPDWNKFNFEFSATETYEDISAFYREVEKQGYRVEWTYINSEDIQRLEEDGQLFLFQIYNKDFAVGSTGKPNLHTLYLKNLFSEENLRDIVLKLNGEAEIFFRKSSVQKPVVHKCGSILVNRTYEITENGTTRVQSIPESEYMELYRYFNSEKQIELSDEAKKYLDKVQCNKAKTDIVKDYRYTMDKFFIHLPITINFKVDKGNNVNAIAQQYIAEQEDLHVIGIDRGERNLIYVSIIDMYGNIVEQKSFNLVEQISSQGVTRYYDYKEKLQNREEERDKARKSWKTIGKIKELKEGYLSSVIHEIAQMVVKYNAIIAMEDLNYGFKRGRFKVERQVYQKFETMLISKLNYLADKSLAVDEPGGILRGYQMTYVPDNFKNVGRQCGIIFYVPAAYTSKIDPTSGFINAFKRDVVSTNDAKENFVMKFDSIQYDREKGLFKFSFDYKNFATHKLTLAKTKWDVYTNGTRIQKVKVEGHWLSREVELTTKMKELLDDSHIPYEEGQNMLDDLREMNDITTVVNGILEIFWLTVQLRNSRTDNPDYDRIISPVLNHKGEFFDSDQYKAYADAQKAPLPIDADANGAYCIALKGMYTVNQIKENWVEGEKLPADCLKIEHASWLAFMQGERE